MLRAGSSTVATDRRINPYERPLSDSYTQLCIFENASLIRSKTHTRRINLRKLPLVELDVIPRPQPNVLPQALVSYGQCYRYG